MIRSLALLFLATQFLSNAQEDVGQLSGDTTERFSCDDITPDLCDLSLTRGEVEVNGLKLTYFIYESAERADIEMFPLVCINGGPGLDHRYMEPLKQHACRGRKVIFYDQIGTGESSVPVASDKSIFESYPWLSDRKYYLKEFKALMSALGFSKVHVLGHSWGGMIAQMYAVEQPKELVGLILDSTLADTVHYTDSYRSILRSSLPPAMRKIIDEAARTGNADDIIFQQIIEQTVNMWMVRTVPRPDCIYNSFNEANIEIAEAMLGPAPGVILEGTLSDFNMTSKLPSISIPTLITRAEHDKMAETVVQTLRDNIPNSQFAFVASSGHCEMIDEPKVHNENIHTFLTRVEQDAIKEFAENVIRSLPKSMRQKVRRVLSKK